jgi:D-alanyl-D-alanine carboxypeptidase, serine-type, PBP4 family
MNKIYSILFALTFSLCSASSSQGQSTQPLKRFFTLPELNGASFSLLAKEVTTGEILYSHDPDRSLTPASVMKLITTATALEVLGEDFRFETILEYDGEVKDGVLHGNLYIRGGGDPTLGSSFFAEDRKTYHPDKNTFLPQWINELTKAGIHTINGSVISDERIFDNEGISRKWLYEDMGSYYGAGCYGISVFDNQYKLALQTGPAGKKPSIKYTLPAIEGLQFHNYLTTANVSSDSSYILGMPWVKERYLYGVVPAGKTHFILRGDIPDPALFLAEYVTSGLLNAGFEITGTPACFRMLEEKGDSPSGFRTRLCSTYSPTLAEIACVTNEVSHNLYADALLKTLGLIYHPGMNEVISSYDRGVNVLLQHWKKKGLNTSALQLYDGSGLAVTDKLTTAFICDLLVYMKKQSSVGEIYTRTIPRAGIEGSVRNFLKGSNLQGYTRLKSGSMTGVKAYAGYIEKDGHTFAVALIVNSYPGEGRRVTKAIEQLLLSLF